MYDPATAAPTQPSRLPAFERLDLRRVVEHVYAGRRVELWREQLRVPGPQPLALRRLVPLTGEGRARVLLVHGLGQNRRTWRLPGRSFEAALAHAGYEVLNLELRGHGRSAQLGSRPATGLDDYLEDLRATLAPLPRPPFGVGHSLGAGMLIRAIAHGLPLAGLVHLAGVYTFASRNGFLRRVAALTERTLPPLLARDTPMPMDALGKLIAWRPRLSDRVNAHLPISGWGRRSMEPALLADRVDLGFDRMGLGVWLDLAQLARGGSIDETGAFARSQLPLLVLSGAADRLASPADARACYDASQSRDKELRVFDELLHGYAPGHIDIIVGQRAPEMVWPRITHWLDVRTTV